MSEKKFKRVFLALDTNNIKSAENYIKLLKNDLAGIKIGKELFSYYGPYVIKKFKKYKLPIFLDLKFHDIPTTVYKSVKAINKLKVNYLSVHSLGGGDMIKAATNASNFTKILTVSILSHHDQKSLKEIGINHSIKLQIKKLINNSLKNNTSGLILAPQDLVLINKINVTDVLYSSEVEKYVSKISSFKNVREMMVKKQRDIVKNSSCVVVGRDIGTIVLPNAKSKFYLTASAEERARRRFSQNSEENPYSKVLKDLKERDNSDMSRKFSPLKVPQNALIINTEEKNIHQVSDEIIEKINNEYS